MIIGREVLLMDITCTNPQCRHTFTAPANVDRCPWCLAEIKRPNARRGWRLVLDRAGLAAPESHSGRERQEIRSPISRHSARGRTFVCRPLVSRRGLQRRTPPVLFQHHRVAGPGGRGRVSRYRATGAGGDNGRGYEVLWHPVPPSPR